MLAAPDGRGTMTAAAADAVARMRWSVRGLAAAICEASAYVAPVVFALLVVIMWLPFGPRNGMPYETGFPYSSETTSWFQGFVYHGDDLRPFTSVFYHLAYLIGQHTGHAGSFVPYQLVYAALWWARGVLVFLILVPFFGRRSAVPFLAGALTIVHASDHALNWVGQLNQFGMMFWLLLAIWLLVRSLLAKNLALAIALCFGAACATYMCLWSYESGLFILMLAPIVLIVVRPALRSFDRLALVAIFYVVPAYYIALSVNRYVGGAGTTYQEAVSRHDLSAGPLASDFLFNVRTSIEFWDWAKTMPPASLSSMHLVGVAAAVTIVGAGVLMYWRRDDKLRDRRALVVLAAVGAITLMLSFPAYLLLTSARSVWRTQFLSGIGFATMAGALAVFAATYIRSRVGSLLVALCLAATVAYFGAGASYKAAHFHYTIWLRHKHAIQEVLEAAPHLKPDTVVVYTGVPAAADPFGDTMWFDMALRLAYPGVPIAGVYFRGGGTPAPGASLSLRHGYWETTNKGYPPLLDHIPVANTLFIRYSTGETHALARLPSFLARVAAPSRYSRRSVVDGEPPDIRALHRYGPLDLHEKTNVG
jgi:hypothetical protein